MRLIEDLLASIAARKAELDRLRPLSGDALIQLQKFYDVELTYTSNAREPLLWSGERPLWQVRPGEMTRLTPPN